MKIMTTRFGEVEVEDDRIIHFDKGLLGFGHFNRYALLQPNDDGTFFWMQSVDDPNLTFIVTDPTLFIEGYSVPLKPDQLTDLGLSQIEDAQVFVIVNKRGNLLTGNLQGPLVINTLNKRASQLVLADKWFNTRVPLVELNPMAASA